MATSKPPMRMEASSHGMPRKVVPGEFVLDTGAKERLIVCWIPLTFTVPEEGLAAYPEGAPTE